MELIDYYLGVFNGTGQNNMTIPEAKWTLQVGLCLNHSINIRNGELELGYGYDFATDENNGS